MSGEVLNNLRLSVLHFERDLCNHGEWLVNAVVMESNSNKETMVDVTVMVKAKFLRGEEIMSFLTRSWPRVLLDLVTATVKNTV